MARRRDRVKMKAYLECRHMYDAFVPHEGNSAKEKVVLYVMLLVWATLEIGTTFSAFDPPVSIEWMRYLILFIVGQQYGLERGRWSYKPPDSNPGAGRGEVQRRLRKTDHSNVEYPNEGNEQVDGREKSGEK